jgi:HEAT repeat protein
MTTIRAEILRFNEIDEDEVWMFPFDALAALQERFPNNHIPGLIELLDDGNPDIRRFAAQILCVARYNSAIPALIKRFDDDDCWVVDDISLFIGCFGPAAAEAIPRLEPWLDSPDDYLRLQAVMAILALDPTRTNLRQMIWDATASEDRAARDLARNFFGMEPDQAP